MGVQFQLGSFRPSCSHPKPHSQWFTYVFAFKETSGQQEVPRRRRGEKQSHYMVACAGGGVLCHWNTKTCIRLNKDLDKGADYV